MNILLSILYDLLYLLLLPVIMLRMWIRGRAAPEYRKRWGERFGTRLQFTQRPILFHTVSLGEAIAATPVIKRLLRDYPAIPVLVTTTTPTGSAHIVKTFGKKVSHQYLPYDLPWIVSAFLRRINPRLFLMMETELWPNYLSQCRKRKIPALLLNARLSEKSARNYARLTPLTRKMLLNLNEILCQADPDKIRFEQLLANPIASQQKPHCLTLGSVKYDFDIAPDLEQKSAAIFDFWLQDFPVWVAASTHPGEEALALKVHQQLLEQFPNLKLILVPRHPERFNEVAENIEQSGLSYRRRSQPQNSDSKSSVFLCDSMGELMICYQRADVAFVGGSLIKRGGHNPLEPAALAKPILSGPHVFNFATIFKQLALQKGASIVANGDQLTDELNRLIAAPDIRLEMGAKAKAFQQSNRGALDRTMARIDRYLSNSQ